MSNGEIQISEESGLANKPQTGLVFSEKQKKMFRDSFLNGASAEEAEALLEVARVRGLNPLLRQIWFVERYDKRKGKVWTHMTSIDGFRSLAERTGLYEGQSEPKFEYDDKGKLVSCKVKIYRKGWRRPCVGLAHLAEFIQPGPFWTGKPHVMLAKVAETIAFRKAFPDAMGGLYTPEEMPEEFGERKERVVNPPSAPPSSLPTAQTAPPPQVDESLLSKARELVEKLPADKMMDGRLAVEKFASNPSKLQQLIARMGELIAKEAKTVDAEIVEPE